MIDAGHREVWEIKWRNGGSRAPLSTHRRCCRPDVEMARVVALRARGRRLLDYCCYGASWRCGISAPGPRGQRPALNVAAFGDAEDNAIITVRFPQAVPLEGT